MNKIKNLLKGSPIAVVVAGLVIAGVASAALVTHLANDVVVEGSVSSPIKMSINNGEDCTESGDTYLNFSPAFGSDPITYTIVSRNQSGGDVTGYNVTINKETDGANLTGEEFTEVKATDWTTGAPIVKDILDDIYVICSNGSLQRLIDYTWDSPKLITTVCYAPLNTSQKCIEANRDALKGTIAGGDKACVATTCTLNQATVGTYQFRGQFADDLEKFAAERYAGAADPCTLATVK